MPIDLLQEELQNIRDQEITEAEGTKVTIKALHKAPTKKKSTSTSTSPQSKTSFNGLDQDYCYWMIHKITSDGKLADPTPRYGKPRDGIKTAAKERLAKAKKPVALSKGRAIGSPERPQIKVEPPVVKYFEEFGRAHCVYGSSDDEKYNLIGVCHNYSIAEAFANHVVTYQSVGYAAVSMAYTQEALTLSMSRSKLDNRGHHYFTECPF